MRRVGAALALVLTLTLAGPVQAATLTWGVNYQRTRQGIVPAEGFVPNAVSPSQPPTIIPLPGQSQSTPVGTQHALYFFTYGAFGQTAWLWRIGLGTSGPSPAEDITPRSPGDPRPAAFVAQPGESFAAPSDPSLSPGGRWLAIGAGARLFWARRAADGSYGAWRMARIAGDPGLRSMVSEGPAFVPGPDGLAAWVCAGNWNGGFGCFDLQTGLPAVLFATDSYAGDNGSLTSSPALVPSGGACFGVASVRDPRLACADPARGLGTAVSQFDAGAIEGPLDTSALFDTATGEVIVQDQWSNLYAIDPWDGRLVREDLMCPRSARCASTIISPALGFDGTLYAGWDGGEGLVAVDARTLQPEGALDPPGASGSGGAWGGGVLSSPTVTAGSSGDWVWEYADGSSRLWLLRVGTGGMAGAGSWSLLPPRPGPSGGTGSFSAVTVGIGPGDGGVALWSDGAVCAWAHGTACGPTTVRPPVGFGEGQGGLEVWQLAPEMLAWAAPDPVTTGGKYWVYALTGQAAAAGVVVRAGGKAQAMRPIGRGTSLSTVGRDLPVAVMMPGWSAALSAAALQANYGVDTPLGEMSGTPPGVFGGYTLWIAGPFPAGSSPGTVPVALTEGTGDGQTYGPLNLIEDVVCPLGALGDAGSCQAPPTCGSGCGAGSGGVPSSGCLATCPAETCPPSLASAMSPSEYQAVCRRPAPYLTDREVVCGGQGVESSDPAGLVPCNDAARGSSP